MFKSLLINGACVIALAIGSPVSAKQQTIAALEEFGRSDNAEALYHLGMMYLTGTQVEKDQSRSVEYFRTAEQLGDPLAAYKLGCFYHGQYDLLELDHDLALQHKLVAAEAGYALAQADVFGLYAQKGDYTRAIYWLEKAVAQGHLRAVVYYAAIHRGAASGSDTKPETLVFETDPVVAMAYELVMLDLMEANDKVQAPFNSLHKQLTPEQQEQARIMHKAYRPQPTALTMRAKSGIEAAEKLVRAN